MQSTFLAAAEFGLHFSQHYRQTVSDGVKEAARNNSVSLQRVLQ